MVFKNTNKQYMYLWLFTEIYTYLLTLTYLLIWGQLSPSNVYEILNAFIFISTWWKLHCFVLVQYTDIIIFLHSTPLKSLKGQVRKSLANLTILYAVKIKLETLVTLLFFKWYPTIFRLNLEMENKLGMSSAKLSSLSWVSLSWGWVRN